jgi:hypothetical protein
MVLKASILDTVLAQDSRLADTFGGRMTYLAAPASTPATFPRLAGTVRPTYIYTSFAAFAGDLASGRLPSAVRAVEYDVEKWAATPVAEQQDHQAYMARFSQLARAHGLLPILAPARDLVLVPGGSCVKRVGENLSQAYIRCGLAKADRQAGALIVQAQVNEFDVAAYRHFLAVVAKQARAGNPRIAVLAQLATAPLGRSASVTQLVAAARSVRGLVQGFSLTARQVDVQTTAGLLWAFGRPASGTAP